MSKEVCINIKSTQKSEDDTDTTELFTFGHMSKMRGKDGYKVEYEESEATGFEGSKVTMEITNEVVTILRTGTALSNLIIEKGKKHHCHYGTPYGDFLVGISTDEIKSSVKEHGGDLYLKYTIDINSGFMSENEMFINIKECENGERN